MPKPAHVPTEKSRAEVLALAGYGRLALVKVYNGPKRSRFVIINRRNGTLPFNGEIIMTDDNYPIMTMSRDWAYKRQKQGHEVTAGDFL